jgi:hypothetical protein
MSKGLNYGPIRPDAYKHGAAPEKLVHFDADSPELLPYVMLTTARRVGDEDLAALSAAVLEFDT